MKTGLGVAFNEADMLGVEVDREQRLAAITLRVLMLPESGWPPPEDTRISLRLHSVTRVAASLTKAVPPGQQPSPLPLTLDDLLETVSSFGGQPIYGWEFFDRHEDFLRWAHRLSLDEAFAETPANESITLFQEGVDHNLDLRLWFERLTLHASDGTPLDPEEVIANGRRWWDAMYAGDPRTQGSGICRANE